VDFESFKESGGIEYTADVIWGLQLDVMNDDIFNSEKKLKEKRETVRIAKKQRPRKIQLVCLKNRYGISNYECGFNYDPVYDLFLPDYELMPVRIRDTPFKD
jgi:replicative DNA helicase